MKSLGMLSGLVFLTCAFAYAGTTDSFRLIKQDDQISLYERDLQYDAGDVSEIKINFCVHTDFNTMINTLRDEKRGLQWNANAMEYKIVTTGSESWTNYIRYNVPWPFEDQDCYLKYCLTNMNDKHAELTFRSAANNSFPRRDGVSRIKGVTGTWEMEQGNNGYIFITYTIIASRGQNIPKCVSDAAVRNSLFKTVLLLKTVLEKNGVKS